MHIFPSNRREWFRAMIFLFKAYTVIAPSLFFISWQLPHFPHTGSTDVEKFLIVGMFPCSLILLGTALDLALRGHKRPAISCAWFGGASFFIGYFCLPYLATA